jgi:SAM-dependent methyltransferase
LFKEAEDEIADFAFLRGMLAVSSTILDLGCGNGGKTVFYAHYFGCEVAGVDISQDVIDIATQFKATRYPGSKATFQKTDGEIAAAPNSYDVVFMNDVMEHVEDPSGILEACYRVLKRGGYVCINFNSYWSAAGDHLSDWIPIPWAHVVFSEKTLVRVLRDMSRSDRYIAFQFPNINKKPPVERFNDLGTSRLNYMTLSRFNRIIQDSKFTIEKLELKGYGERSRNRVLKWILATLKDVPLLKELFGGRVVCILRKV